MCVFLMIGREFFWKKSKYNNIVDNMQTYLLHTVITETEVGVVVWLETTVIVFFMVWC